MMPLFFREGAGMNGSNVCTKCTFNGAVKTDPDLSLDLCLVQGNRNSNPLKSKLVVEYDMGLL